MGPSNKPGHVNNTIGTAVQVWQRGCGNQQWGHGIEDHGKCQKVRDIHQRGLWSIWQSTKSQSRQCDKVVGEKLQSAQYLPTNPSHIQPIQVRPIQECSIRRATTKCHHVCGKQRCNLHLSTWVDGDTPNGGTQDGISNNSTNNPSRQAHWPFFAPNSWKR